MVRYTIRDVDASRRVGVLAAEAASVAPSPWSPPELVAGASRRSAAVFPFTSMNITLVSIIRG